ncbi:hypothetical protein J6590_053388, partial [Homalodisca vitripennis]
LPLTATPVLSGAQYTRQFTMLSAQTDGSLLHFNPLHTSSTRAVLFVYICSLPLTATPDLSGATVHSSVYNAISTD